MEYRAGDCDDLSATYAALLESVGIETAFLTIPGHIFVAFKLGSTSEADARSGFANSSDLIFRDDGTVWVPVEVTVPDRGFLQAWSTLARQWREHALAGTAALLPTSVASDRELLQRLEERPSSTSLRNRLGVLYARYDQVDAARDQFQLIVDREESVPALVNLANLSFLIGAHAEADKYYERALAVSPSNPIPSSPFGSATWTLPGHLSRNHERHMRSNNRW